MNKNSFFLLYIYIKNPPFRTFHFDLLCPSDKRLLLELGCLFNSRECRKLGLGGGGAVDGWGWIWTKSNNDVMVI